VGGPHAGLRFVFAPARSASGAAGGPDVSAAERVGANIESSESVNGTMSGGVQGCGRTMGPRARGSVSRIIEI
jgi:hypothetical protein